MFAARTISLLFWVSVSHSAILPSSQPSCQALVKPLAQLDPHQMEGRWALVANNGKFEPAEAFELSDSVAIDFFNSTFSKANRNGERCSYLTRNISDITINGPDYNFAFRSMVMRGTFYHTSCSDCLIMSFIWSSPHFLDDELCLFSKRREVEKEEMEEFVRMVECMNRPAPVKLNPTMPLCPVHSHQ